LNSKRNQLVRELEETTRLVAMLHTQLKRYVACRRGWRCCHCTRRSCLSLPAITAASGEAQRPFSYSSDPRPPRSQWKAKPPGLHVPLGLGGCFSTGSVTLRWCLCLTTEGAAVSDMQR